ncbi:MAG: tripartite tricarboxylate transporter substrate binding protein [Duodenibacillus sp.]|nr:tripartite tricarboxylate transporter substrate binding protein [Duodenibacillus sp.]
MPTLAQTGTSNNPIRIVVPYPPGGPLDVSARAIAEAVSDELGNVIVDNRPGAGGNRGVTYLAQQKPDGMTMCVGAVATHAVNPNLFKKLPYDPIKDFEPVTLIAHVPNVLVVTPAFRDKYNIRSVADLVAYCRKNPDKLNYASGGNGSAGHMAGELLKSQARIKVVHVPYQGAAAAKLSVLSGQTDFMFDNLASATANIRDGKFVPLAVTTSTRAKALPDVPTMIESGVAGFDISTWYGLFVPAKTPAKTVNRLNRVITAALKSDKMKERLAKLGGESAPCSPAEFSKLIKLELAKYARIVKVSGARVD